MEVSAVHSFVLHLERFLPSCDLEASDPSLRKVTLVFVIGERDASLLELTGRPSFPCPTGPWYGNHGRGR